jgi:hypothetical protein
MALFLYLISQNVNTGYDTYDSAVVVAESEHEARHTPPGDLNWYGEWPLGEWAAPGDVTAELIGIAIPGIKPGVICASFNAG